MRPEPPLAERGRGRLYRGWALWLVAGSLAQAASLWGQPVPVRYALGEIVASGGNPIGDGKGLLFRQTFEPDCQLSPPDPKSRPVSGFLGGNVQLRLKIISCPAAAPPPTTTQCELKVGGAEQSTSFAGWETDLALPLPIRTGIFPLHLACTIEAQPAEPFETALYMTWKKAKPPVLPDKKVRVEWYQRACTWGAGLDAKATEREVMETVMAGLYAYGQRHWRYGFGLPGGFCGFCTGKEGVGECKCRCDWFSLVDESNPCQSGDCFAFSSVLTNIIAMMGVVVTQGSTNGDFGRGFATDPDLRSLDPEFAGSLKCGPRLLPCSYLFQIHSFVNLNSVMYDATFDGVYESLSDLIGENVLKDLGGNNFRLESSVACFQSSGYGGWNYYHQLPFASDCRIDDTKPARLLSEPVKSAPVSTRGDSRPEMMGVFLEVEIQRAGSYRVGGGLYHEGRPVSLQSSDRTQFAIPEVIVSGEPGRHRVRLLFSGEDIVQARITGPLILHAWLASEQGLVSSRTAEVPPLTPAALRSLGERPARFNQPLEVTVKQQRRSFRLEVPVQVREDGDVNLLSRLSCHGETIAIESTGKPLTRGDHVLELELQANLELEGPCLAALALNWGYPPEPVDWQEVGVHPLP